MEELPDDLEADKVKEAVDKLLAAYPGEEVTLYLHLFQLQRSKGWEAIADILENDKRLQLSPATV